MSCTTVPQLCVGRRLRFCCAKFWDGGGGGGGGGTCFRRRSHKPISVSESSQAFCLSLACSHRGVGTRQHGNTSAAVGERKQGGADTAV